jgi:nucleoid-associated protein YgaU
MELELQYLTILVETPGSKDNNLQFGNKTSDNTIVAMFNPNKLTLSRSIQWQDQKAAKRDNPEMQFTGADPGTLTIDLVFDTYDTPEREVHKQSVKDYTDKLVHLTTVEWHGEKHRPPVCQLTWGNQGFIFQGVLQQLQIQFTMFTVNGTPVRATTNCTFKQWRPNSEDLRKQSLMSSDLAKVWVVKRGQSLATIASAEYGDPRAWRIIADANGIDNPLRLAPGTRLLLPARTVAWSSAVPPWP